MNPKGKLIVIGGAVDKGSFTEKNFDKQVEKNLNFFETGILKRLLVESRLKENSQIEIITTASKIPKEVGPEYAKALEYLGAKNVNVLHIETRDEALKEENASRIEKADVVLFTGGDQLRLTSILGGTPIHDLILHKYVNEDFIYAGTSAGAAAASNSILINSMINSSSSALPLIQYEQNYSQALSEVVATL